MHTLSTDLPENQEEEKITPHTSRQFASPASATGRLGAHRSRFSGKVSHRLGFPGIQGAKQFQKFAVKVASCPVSHLRFSFAGLVNTKMDR
jgi:hypothetical protein